MKRYIKRKKMLMFERIPTSKHKEKLTFEHHMTRKRKIVNI